MNKPSIILGPIVGGLSHISVNIWARANASSTLHVWLAKKEDLKDAKQVGEIELPEIDGFAGVVPVTDLEAETKYFYRGEKYVVLQFGAIT